MHIFIILAIIGYKWQSIDVWNKCSEVTDVCWIQAAELQHKQNPVSVSATDLFSWLVNPCHVEQSVTIRNRQAQSPGEVYQLHPEFV